MQGTIAQEEMRVVALAEVAIVREASEVTVAKKRGDAAEEQVANGVGAPEPGEVVTAGE